MSVNRLRSKDAFSREEEYSQRKGKKAIIIAAEGACTERHYFEHLYKHLNTKDTVFLIEVLRREGSEGDSTPEYVIELLDEYMSIRKDGLNKDDWVRHLENKYPDETIQGILDNSPHVSTDIKNEILNALLAQGIDLVYRKLLSKTTLSEEDIFAAVIDRDRESGRTPEKMLSYIDKCKQKGYDLYISNPCFEFWLLLHLCDVKAEYADKLGLLLENKRESIKHTYVSLEVAKRAHHGKSITSGQFQYRYLPNIRQAMERSRSFSVDRVELIDHLGTNVTDLILKMGYQ